MWRWSLAPTWCSCTTFVCQCPILESHGRRSTAGVWTSFLSRNLMFSLLILTLIWAKVKCRSSCPSLYFNHLRLFSLMFPYELSFIWFANFHFQFHVFVVLFQIIFKSFSISEAQSFGTVSEAWDSPGTLGLSQRPRVPTPWGIYLILRDPNAWDSPNFKVFDTCCQPLFLSVMFKNVSNIRKIILC